MSRLRTQEDQLWEETAKIILPQYIDHRATPCRESDITRTLACWRGKVISEHPALRMLEEYRECWRGEREELDADDVNVLVLKILEIALLAR